MNAKAVYWLLASLSFPILISACSRNFSPAAPPLLPTATPTQSGTPESTATSASGSPTPTSSVTAAASPTVPCAPLTVLKITANLDPNQPANARGGVLNLGTGAAPVLSLALPGILFNTNKLNIGTYGTGKALFQAADFTAPAGVSPNQADPLVFGAVEVFVVGANAGSYAWDQSGVLPAGVTVVKNITDMGGHPRQITLLFYQVNDIATASPAVNPNPPHQAAWAWYAFDTTGGGAPSTSDLIEGTGIIQGSYFHQNFPSPDCFVDRGTAGDSYWGDLVFFNSDGSLASEGAVRDTGTAAVQAKPEIVLPPLGGWPSIPPMGPGNVGATLVELDFGTAGMPGYGQKDGLTANGAAASPTFTPTSQCAPSTVLDFTGNLDSAQRADAPGGVLNLGTSSAMVLPLAFDLVEGPGDLLNSNKLKMVSYGSGNAISQTADLTSPLDTVSLAPPHHTTPLINTGLTVETVQAKAGSYAWEQSASVPAGVTVVKGLTDAAGKPRQVTFLFYQVNDLGSAGINSAPDNQAAWAWYAFDTTGGAIPNSSDLIEGTNIIQGSYFYGNFPGPDCFVDRGSAGDLYWGGLVYFNSDGSLASEGAVRDSGGVGVQAKPEIVLPPLGGWPSTIPVGPDNVGATLVELNFGTAGMPGYGQKDGLTGDAAPSAVH